MIERILKHHPIALVFMVMALVIIALAAVVQNELDSRDEQNARFQAVVETVAREQISRRVDECQSANSSRAALQTVLEQVADPPDSGAAAVDFSKVQGWDGLTSETKFFLANLTVALRDTDPNFLVGVAASYKKSNPQKNCMELERGLRKNLKVDYPS